MTSRLARALCSAGLLLAAGCAATGSVEDIEPGERPALESEEAGFWMVMDEAERELRISGRIVTDEALNAYVRSVVCELAGPYCKDIRVYVVRHAGFNAMMAPNGAMHIWTGMLLRAENEAQLAFVVGHELTHYLRRHTLKRWRDIRAKTDAAVFLGLAVGLAGAGSLGMAGAQLIALGSIAAFSRDQEREADEMGFEMIKEAGYDPRQAPAIWQALIEEKEAGDWPEPPVFFATHPTSEERERTLSEMAEEAASDAPGETFEDRHLIATLHLRGTWLRDELRQRNYGSMAFLLDRLIETGHGLGELHYFYGEMYRLRGEEGDEDNAIEAYRRAIDAGAAPPETYRSLGFVHWHAGDRAAAREAFETYLGLAPGAEDRLMIEAHIEELKRETGS